MKTDIEAILFMSKNEIDINDLVNFFNVSREIIEREIKNLINDYKERGINICFENDMVYIKSNPIKGEVIKNYFTPELKLRKLSQSAFEVLAIIAYKGPITKSEIEDIKGNGIDHIIPVLIEKKLIYASSRKKALGNPNLYEVTDEFYAYLNIKNKEELLSIEKSNILIPRKENTSEN